MKLRVLIFLFAIHISILLNCGNNSEEKCKDDAKTRFRDFCIGGLITNPIVNPDGSSLDQIYTECLYNAYKLEQCNKKSGNIDIYSIVH
ncbi:hypothetical protein CLV96_3868 [Leptospira meyeri]|uniref:Lipoprotein n=1 Tax=Leptospira meyeri TaxID=29508 RepID=A0A4R8MPZ5_LEPME|nr:hypothetical protein [Leptospira meyeri]TDY66758.1 hypothetical protein CLV96_3868 [Leptospira meyeri]